MPGSGKCAKAIEYITRNPTLILSRVEVPPPPPRIAALVPLMAMISVVLSEDAKICPRTPSSSHPNVEFFVDHIHVHRT
jgi:hypothetical protein